MTNILPLNELEKIQTPFYHYDLQLLNKTLKVAQTEAKKHNFHIHYALKANNNTEILSLIQDHKIGGDCVSGNEIKTAIEHNFPAEKIFFAGVGKTDEEIKTAIKFDIYCFNVESIQELEVINHWADHFQKTVNIALRLNPDINAKTHHYISKIGRAHV